VPSPSFATASGATGCGAGAINNNGQILGGCDDANSYSHAVLWENGTPTDLGTFGGGCTRVWSEGRRIPSRSDAGTPVCAMSAALAGGGRLGSMLLGLAELSALVSGANII
jgi:probable HAF family extracellular repeat protein